MVFGLKKINNKNKLMGRDELKSHSGVFDGKKLELKPACLGVYCDTHTHTFHLDTMSIRRFDLVKRRTQKRHP